MGAIGAFFPSPARSAEAADKTDKADTGGKADKIGKMPHLELNVAKRFVRVECESLAVDAPLEFFCCLNGTNEHESVLRTAVRPFDLHVALLAIGLQPGAPMTYSESSKKWLPPHGPPLRINVEFEKDGKTVRYPAYRWLRDVKTKKECPAFSWVFCGSRVMKGGRYAADDTGYIVSIVNFDFVMIDIPELASSNNDLLEWERNPDLMPEKGTKVWMVIEPLGNEPAGASPGVPPATVPSAPAAPPQKSASPAPQIDPLAAALGGRGQAGAPNAGPAGGSASTAAGTEPSALAELEAVRSDEAKVHSMIEFHDRVLGPRAGALREAAQAHYEVIESLRKEQQRLITEADLIQRAIDELEKKYQDLTTPQPAGTGGADRGNPPSEGERRPATVPSLGVP